MQGLVRYRNPVLVVPGRGPATVAGADAPESPFKLATGVTVNLLVVFSLLALREARTLLRARTRALCPPGACTPCCAQIGRAVGGAGGAMLPLQRRPCEPIGDG